MLFSYYDLLGCFHTFFLVSVRYPLFHCWRFLRHTLGFTKVCWTKFYATTITVFSRSAFSDFATQCSTQSFHDVAYLCITSPIFARFLRYWQVNVIRNIFACRFPRHDCFASFIKMTKCVYAIRIYNMPLSSNARSYSHHKPSTLEELYTCAKENIASGKRALYSIRFTYDRKLLYVYLWCIHFS